jgi:hypothetical protein
MPTKETETMLVKKLVLSGGAYAAAPGVCGGPLVRLD